MGGIAGIYSPRRPSLATAEHLQRLLAALRHRSGAQTRQRCEPAQGLAIGHVYGSEAPGPRPAGTGSEADPPGWHAAPEGVSAMDGWILNSADLLGGDCALASPGRALAASVRRERGEFARALDGSFGLAHWDAEGRVLRIARDPLGSKPLYYHHDAAAGLVIFASEPKAILAHPAVQRRVDPSAFALFLTFGYVPAPHCIFSGLRKVFPGTVVSADASGRIAERAFWRMPRPEPAQGNFEELARETRERVLERFERQLAGVERPGVLLSGGVDSTLVVGILRLLGHREVPTFSLGFRMDGVASRLSEDLEWGVRVGGHFSTRHHAVVFGADHRPAQRLSRVWRQFDEPMLSPNVYSKDCLFEAVRRAGVTHCLSGLGAEDLFDRLPEKKLRKLREKAGGDPDPLEAMILRYNRFLSFDEQRELLVEPCDSARDRALETLRRYSSDVEADDLGELMYLTMVRMLGAEKSVAIQDRTSVLHGIEARHPFQDAPLLRFARTLPAAARQGGGVPKALLKAAFSDVLPRDVADREKIGYPSYYWNRGELAELRERLLSPEALERTGIFRADAVRRICDADARSERRSAGKRVWGLMAIQAWYELHIHEDASALGERSA